MGMATATPPGAACCVTSDDPYFGLGQSSFEKLIETEIRKYRSFFKPFPDWQHADLLQECVCGVMRSRRLYTPGRSSPSTWITTVAGRRLKDLQRVLGRRLRKEVGYADEVMGSGTASMTTETPDTLVEWLEEIYVRTRGTMNAYRIALRSPTTTGSTRGGAMDREDHPDLAQTSALLALQHRLGKSCREMSDLCRERPALLAAIGVTRPLSPMFFSRARDRVTVINFRPTPAAVE